MENDTFNVDGVRAEFPALRRTYNAQRVIYLDGPGGSQVTRGAIEAVARYMSSGGANRHGVFPTSVETETLLCTTRQTVAQLLNARADEIAFGPNMTTLTMAMARALGRQWEENDEIVVTEIDHRANVDPWLLAAADAGARVRWITVDPDTLTLDLGDLDNVINARTKLVAVNLASNGVGTINDVAQVAQRAHAVGALVAVDAVHAAAHIPIDRDALGADIVTCSAYKFFGPHVGVAAIKRDVFEAMQIYKLEPAADGIPDKLETGTQNHEGIAGLKEAVTFISTLGSGASLREQLISGMTAIESYESELAENLRSALRRIPQITLYAAPDECRKTPTFAFTVAGYTPKEVCEHLLSLGFFVANGSFYASTLAGKLGVHDRGGWVRAGLAPYNTAEELDAFVTALRKLIG